MSVAAATIVAKEYLALARVIARSFRHHHPEIPFFVLLTDEVESKFEPEQEPYTLLHFDELELEDGDRLRFRYPQQPLAYACTPMLLEHLLDRGFDRVLFFKQESLVLARMDDALEQLDHCAVLLTPHLVAPLAGTDAADRERIVLLSGVYNIGFVGVAESESARCLLEWWSERTRSWCLHAIGSGMHFEQRWMDLAPAYFDGVRQLRDPAYNVAHWNLPDRRVVIVDGHVRVDGRRCRLFRFSGFDPERPNRPTRYFERPRMQEIGDAAKIFADYSQRLASEGYWTCRKWPYAWGTFDNGVAIPDVVREIHRELEVGGTVFEQPFSTDGDGSFYGWLNAPASAERGGRVTNLWQQVWQRRPDVQEVYPDPTGADHEGFQEWARTSGAREHQIQAELVP